MAPILAPKKIELGWKLDKIFQVEPSISDDDIKNVSDYMSSGSWITESKVTHKLENSIKSYLNRDYAVAVPNGTIAIYLSLLAAGVKEGMKVGIPNLTMIATINAVLWAKAEPVLIDVNEDLCLSYQQLVILKDELDCVIFVPLNGRTSEGEDIKAWCSDNEIILVEDSAHALGSNYQNSKCGSLGDLSILSFTPHKIITMGQGGMILTDNEEFYNYLISIKTFNRVKDKSDWHEGFGLNFKITDLQSSLGLSQFGKLELFISKKLETLKYYQQNITLSGVKIKGFEKHEVPWFFDIEFENETIKKDISEYLESKGIETRNSYPALSSQPYLKKYKKGDLAVSEEIYNKILWLPSGNNLDENQLEYICNTISNY